MIYAVFGVAGLVVFGLVTWALRMFGSANEHVGQLTERAKEDETALQAVKDKADAEDEVARMSPDARRGELSKWGRG